jgi:hypothetical protein
MRRQDIELAFDAVIKIRARKNNPRMLIGASASRKTTEY